MIVVKQKHPLSPIFFAFYVDEVSNHIVFMHGGDSIQILQYADDIVSY